MKPSAASGRNQQMEQEEKEAAEKKTVLEEF